MADITFQNGAIWVRSELNMVNDSLIAVGETPFVEGTLVDMLPIGSDGEVSKRIIRTTMIEVQSRGWYFNTDYDFTLIPDSHGFITMPPNTLRLDFGFSEGNRYAEKNGQIYDYLNQTFIIEEPIVADVVWLVDYAELPAEAYEYISSRSARKAQQRIIGSPETDSFTVRDEADAFTNLMRRQLQSQDYSIQNSRVSTRTHSGFLTSSLYGNKGRRRY